MTAHRFSSYSFAFLLVLVCSLLMPGCGGGSSSSKNNSGGTGNPTAGSPPPGGGNTTGGSGTTTGSTTGSGTTSGGTTGSTTGGTTGGGTGGTTGGGTTGGSAAEVMYISNSASGDVTAFKIDPQDGSLSSLEGSPFATGPNTDKLALAGNTALIVRASTIDSTGTRQNNLTAWSIDANSGALSKGSSVSNPRVTGGVTPLVANADSVYSASGKILGFAHAHGSLSELPGSPYDPGPSGPSSFDAYDLQLDRDGNFLYAAVSGFRDARGFQIWNRAADGSLSNMHFAKGVNGGTIASFLVRVHPSNRFVYEFRGSLNEITVYSLDPATGNTAVIDQSARFRGSQASDAIFTKGGRFMLVANLTDGSISVFAIDQNTGTLKEVAGSPFAAGARPISLALDTNEKFVFVIHGGGDTGSNDLIGYRFDNATGALTQFSRQTLGGNPQQIVIR